MQEVEKPVSPETELIDEGPVRPVGTWVVAGFLVFAIVTIWWLSAAVFHARS